MLTALLLQEFRAFEWLYQRMHFRCRQCSCCTCECVYSSRVFECALLPFKSKLKICLQGLSSIQSAVVVIRSISLASSRRWKQKNLLGLIAPNTTAIHFTYSPDLPIQIDEDGALLVLLPGPRGGKCRDSRDSCIHSRFPRFFLCNCKKLK